MPPLDVDPDRLLLAQVVGHPDRIPQLTAHELSRLLDAAADARLLGWLLTRLESTSPPFDMPPWLSARLNDVRARTAEAERSIRWEINRLQRAFAGTGIVWVLLKGAGYVAAGLQPGRGRQVADIDLLVPEAQLEAAEAALKAHGWLPATLDPYDERYYRQWAHELPPMVHVERESVVDLHHAILQRTSRLRPSSSRLMARVVDAAGCRVLCPSHMVLHAAAHLFHDGEVAGAIRDLVDIDELLRTFGADADFWPDWLEEARALELKRPAFYTIRYASRLAGTPVPPDVLTTMQAWAPPGPLLRVMDVLVGRTLSGRPGAWTSVAAFLLYVRAHWLRMPPLLLVRHLIHQAFFRPK